MEQLDKDYELMKRRNELIDKGFAMGLVDISSFIWTVEDEQCLDIIEMVIEKGGQIEEARNYLDMPLNSTHKALYEKCLDKGVPFKEVIDTKDLIIAILKIDYYHEPLIQDLLKNDFETYEYAKLFELIKRAEYNSISFSRILPVTGKDLIKEIEIKIELIHFPKIEEAYGIEKFEYDDWITTINNSKVFGEEMILDALKKGVEPEKIACYLEATKKGIDLMPFNECDYQTYQYAYQFLEAGLPALFLKNRATLSRTQFETIKKMLETYLSKQDALLAILEDLRIENDLIIIAMDLELRNYPVLSLLDQSFSIMQLQLIHMGAKKSGDLLPYIRPGMTYYEMIDKIK